MAKTCSICKHENRLDIDWMIVNQISYRDISLRFGVGVMSVQRHRKHIETELREVQEVQKIERGTSILEKLFVNQQRIEDALQRARNAADLRSEALLIKLEQSNLDVEAKLTGAYKDKPEQPRPEQKFDLTAIKMEEMRERGEEVTREEAERLVHQETAEFIRLARKTGHDVAEGSTTIH